jgi:hypothetical protein
MSFHHNLIAAFAVALVMLPAAAWSQSEPIFALASNGFKEVVREGALISGAVVVGTQALGPVEGEDFVLRAFVPSELRGSRICLDVKTINGLYEASGTYDVPKDWLGGLAILPFPTEQDELLAGRKGDELAFRVTHNDCAAPVSDSVSVVLQNHPETGRVTVMLNSFQAEAVYLYVGGQAEPILCNEINSMSPTAFDTRCDIPLAGLGGKVPVEVYRMVERKVAPPTNFVIWLPDA